MYALTIWQPWAGLIACADPTLACVHHKTIETRTWQDGGPNARMADKLRGQRIAIHAGLTFDRDAAAWLRKLGITPPESRAAITLTHARGAVIATAVMGDVRHLRRTTLDAWRAVSAGLSEAAAREVADGMHGTRLALELAEVRALARPVPCQGKQGWWELGANELADVLAGEPRAPQPTITTVAAAGQLVLFDKMEG